MSWYRTYRPQRVADLHIKPVREALLRILESGEFSHAYLLAGPKGTGKTSAARILAKVLNCERNRSVVEQILKRSSKQKVVSSKGKQEIFLQEPCNVCDSCIAITNGSSMSVTEMDAASNRGIDDIRELRERIGLSPADGVISVFIIDEVHMLTTEAFNALLKVLEEPPAHVVFILATTDAQKMPATVVSRCTLIQYRKATPAELQERLSQIATAEKISVPEESLALIATAADGSFRDGVKLFEQLASGKKKLEKEDVETLLGAFSSRLSADILMALLKKDSSAVIDTFSKLTDRGIDGVAFQKEVLTLAHGKLVEFARQNDPRLSTLVGLMHAIAVPIETNLPIAWMPFEIACIEYSLDSSKQYVVSSKAQVVSSKGKEVEQKKTVVQTYQLSEPIVPEKKATPIMEEKKPEEAQEKPEVKVIAVSLPDDGSIQITFEKVQEQWPIVLAKIKQKSVPMEGLLRAIRLTSIDGRSVLLEATYQFHKEQMELNRNALILETIFQEVFGAPLRYTVTLGKSATRVIGSPHRNVTGNTEDDKLVKAAEEAFL